MLSLALCCLGWASGSREQPDPRSPVSRHGYGSPSQSWAKCALRIAVCSFVVSRFGCLLQLPVGYCASPPMLFVMFVACCWAQELRILSPPPGSGVGAGRQGRVGELGAGNRHRAGAARSAAAGTLPPCDSRGYLGAGRRTPAAPRAGLRDHGRCAGAAATRRPAAGPAGACISLSGWWCRSRDRCSKR
jgi:hypothetical protein